MQSQIHDTSADATYSQVAAIANRTNQAIARAFIAGAPNRGQVVTERLEQDVPPATVDVLAGTFTWIDAAHVPHSAPFYVRTCPEFDSAECRDRRDEDYNEQFADQYFDLERSGCQHIAFSEAKPSPFF